MHSVDILQITKQVEDYMTSRESSPNVYNVINALDKLGHLRNIKPQDVKEVYPVYDANHECDDVGLCPRCRGVDIFPGQRVCRGCAEEMMDYNAR